MQRGLGQVSKHKRTMPACRELCPAAQFGWKDDWGERSGGKVLTRSPPHHRGTDLGVPWLMIRARAKVLLCRSLLGLQTTVLRDEGVVCREVKMPGLSQ